MDSKFRFTTQKPTNEYSDTTNFSYPIIPNNRRRDTRLCRINNYIPNVTPKYTSLERWSEIYIMQLIDIFNIIKHTIMVSSLYKTIDWKSPVIYNNLCRLIYHCSSKYILPHNLIDYTPEYTSDSDSDSDS